MRCQQRCFPIALFIASFYSVALGDVASEVRSATGAHTRFAWSQDQSNEDMYAAQENDYLYGFDSDDGKGARKILEALSCYQKPLLTSDGNRVVYTHRKYNPDKWRIFVVGFDGSGHKEVAVDLLSSCVRNINGVEWVYAKKANYNPAKDTIIRFNLDNPSQRQVVWTKTRVDMGLQQSWFSVSGDGKYAYSCFPWKDGPGALASLPDGDTSTMGGGCWPSIAADNSYNWFIMEGGHYQLVLGNQNGVRMGTRNPKRQLQPVKVRLTTMPEAANFTNGVYWPKFTNDARFLVLGFPEVSRKDCEVYLGKFNPELDTIEKWVRVTSNQSADYFPDCWISPTEKPTLAAPTISPEQTEFTGTLSIQLSAPIAGSTIRYTKDGSEPTAQSPVYTAPFTVTATTKVSARCYKDSLVSVVSTKTYTLVNSFIFTTLKALPESVSVAQNGTVQFSASALDQFGKALAQQPTVTWAVRSGPGTITPAGFFTASARDTGKAIVEASATIGIITKKASVSVSVSSSSLRLIRPTGGEKFYIDDTMVIEWAADPLKINGVVAEISVDDGRSWVRLSDEGVLSATKPFTWLIAATIGDQDISTVSTQCRIRISEYFASETYKDISNGTFTIQQKPSSSTYSPRNMGDKAPIRWSRDGRILWVKPGAVVKLLRTDGRHVDYAEEHNGVALKPGTYIIKVVDLDATLLKPFVVLP